VRLSELLGQQVAFAQDCVGEEVRRMAQSLESKGVLLLVENSPLYEGEGLICDRCKLLYPVRDGIPVMLIDEAIPAE
jgi:uncharacterized protein YbaR (Trm112 family)